MASGGMRVTTQSGIEEPNAVQNISRYHWPRHWQYCVLWAGVSIVLFFQTIFVLVILFVVI
jgi:hypothetical protein